MSRNRSKGSPLKGAPIPVFRFTATPQWQTFLATKEYSFNSSPSENVCILQYGGSTVLKSPANKLLTKDLQCADKNTSQISPIYHDLSLSSLSSEFAFILPRQGQPYATCGTVKAIHKTMQDKCTDIYRFHCDRPECPDPYCQDYTLSFEAKKDADRLTEMAYLYYTEQNIKLGYSHPIIFSPPQDHAKELCSYPDGFKKLRSECIEKAKDAGVLGGVCVPHMFRILGENEEFDDDTEDLMTGYVSGGIADNLRKAGYGIGKGGKGSLWDGVFANALNLNSSYDYVYLSPHFHVHGYGFLKNSRTFYNEIGWIYKKGRALKNNIAMASSIRYVLSHVTRLEVLGSVVSKSDSWFGNMAYNKGGVNEIYGETVPKLCVHRFQYYEAAIHDTSLLYNEVWVKQLIRTFRLTSKLKPPPKLTHENISDITTEFFLDMSEIHEIEGYMNIN